MLYKIIKIKNYLFPEISKAYEINTMDTVMKPIKFHYLRKWKLPFHLPFIYWHIIKNILLGDSLNCA